MPPRKRKEVSPANQKEVPSKKSKEVPPKKAPPKKPKHSDQLVVFLLDANSTANVNTADPSKTDFEVSSSIVESILTQKIFSRSHDICSVVFFGFERERSGCYVSSEFERPIFFTITKLRDEEKPRTSSSVPNSVDKPIKFAIEQIDEYTDENPNSDVEASIFLLSNLDSTPTAMLTENLAKELGKLIEKRKTKHKNDREVKLFVVSPDALVDEIGSPKANFMNMLSNQCEAEWVKNSECKLRFGTYTGKKTKPTGTAFSLKLGPDIDIKVQSYKKNEEVKLDHNFTSCRKNGIEMKKHFQYTIKPDVKINLNEIDDIQDEEIVSGNFKKAEKGKRDVDRENLINAYYYGKTIVSIDMNIKDDFEPEMVGKELRLIQFTKRENILPQFILSTPRYVLPAEGAIGSQRVFRSLVKELLDKELVAIVRYAFNIRSNAKIVALFPKITKSGMPMFIQYQLPYGDDVRFYEFANLDTPENQIDEDGIKSDIIQTYIETLMIKDGEKFRPKYIPNPRIEHELLLLKKKVLEPSEPIKRYEFVNEVMKNLRMPNTDEVNEAGSALAAAFELQPDEKERLKVKIFGNRPMGVDPIDYQESEDIDYQKSEGNGTVVVKKKEQDPDDM